MSNEILEKEKLLISACLFGENVRYDGKNNLIEELDQLKERYELISICPEVLGGMVIPRIPSEIVSTNPLKIQNEFGIDTTEFFTDGAMQALYICQKYDIKKALLKSKSPSCGNLEIYDGNFNGTLVKGQGITANILIQNNIKVFNEKQIGDLI